MDKYKSYLLFYHFELLSSGGFLSIVEIIQKCWLSNQAS